jgi:hypothetical protein
LKIEYSDLIVADFCGARIRRAQQEIALIASSNADVFKFELIFAPVRILEAIRHTPGSVAKQE